MNKSTQMSKIESRWMRRREGHLHAAARGALRGGLVGGLASAAIAGFVGAVLGGLAGALFTATLQRRPESSDSATPPEANPPPAHD